MSSLMTLIQLWEFNIFKKKFQLEATSFLIQSPGPSQTSADSTFYCQSLFSRPPPRYTSSGSFSQSVHLITHTCLAQEKYLGNLIEALAEFTVFYAKTFGLKSPFLCLVQISILLLSTF